MTDTIPVTPIVPDPEAPARLMWGSYIGAPAYFIDGRMFAHTVGPTAEHVLVYLHDDGDRKIVGEFVAPSLAVARYLIEEKADRRLRRRERERHSYSPPEWVANIGCLAVSVGFTLLVALLAWNVWTMAKAVQP